MDTRVPFRIRQDVSLGSLMPEHARRMFGWMSDSEVAANIGLTKQPSLERTLSWILGASTDPALRAYAILSGGLHVGNVVLDMIDTYVSKARLSIYVGEATARGGGIGSTALWLALNSAFNDLGLHKVWLTVHSKNLKALHIYHRMGFQIEGELRDDFLLNGERLNTWYMGILAEEFARLIVSR